MPDMLRQLLTVLALVTGLAGLVGPVQAAPVAASVASERSESPAADCASKRVQLLLPAMAEAARGPREAPCAGRGTPIVVPTIQLQADRARE